MESINRNRPNDSIQRQAELSALIAKAEESIASGKSFTRPSEAPSSWLEISSLGRKSSIENSWLNNIGRAGIMAQQAESSLDTMATAAIRAKELLILANNETLSTEDREVIAIELESLYDQFNQLAQAEDSYGGKLFHTGDPIQMRIDTNVLVTPSPNLQTVTQSIDVGGVTTDLDTIMTAMIDAVRAGTAADRALQLEAGDSLVNHFSSLVASQGLLVNRLDEQEDRLNLSQLTSTERRSVLESTDIPEAVARFQSLLVNLEAAQKLYATSNNNSLIRLIG
ncbi:flagellin [uncultured Parasphingorhabdus sp.]|uniref:flagellin n=1 Tax=uncultured Parasphingorhabdus sp. TaxID=2709694 RepID=UPI0030DC2465|tara:strand:- start:57784 stop:58629 length:846 start_codon:yes stop_codon:yes gene_type:complete